MGNCLQGLTSGIYLDTCCPGGSDGLKGVFSGDYKCCACCGCCNRLSGWQRKILTTCCVGSICVGILVIIIFFTARAVKVVGPTPYVEPVSFEAWNTDSRMVVAGESHVAKVAGGHTVAGASSQKTIYRSFEEFGGVNHYAGIQGVEFSMASRGRSFGVGLVQAREDQFEYGAPVGYKYDASGFIMYVSEDGAIRIEEKARVGRRRLHAVAKSSLRKAAEATSDRQLEEAATATGTESAADTEIPIFCNFDGDTTGYCEQCYDVPDCNSANLNEKGVAACRAACSSFKADLPPLKVKKHEACSYETPCTASNFKVEQYETSEELYISAVCPPHVAPRAAAVQVASAAGYRKLQYGGVQGMGVADPCHFGYALPGDAFAVTVDSATLRVTYWHNGRVIYESQAVPEFPLLVDAYMLDQGAKVIDAVWKCPTKFCPPGTSDHNCERLRAKAPAGCNFINQNFDYAPVQIKNNQPYLTPPRGSGKDGGSWWVWVIVAVIVLFCCCCGWLRKGGFACIYSGVSGGGFGFGNTGPSSGPVMQKNVPVAVPQPRIAMQPMAKPVVVRTQQPLQPPQPESAVGSNYWEIHKNLGA